MVDRSQKISDINEPDGLPDGTTTPGEDTFLAARFSELTGAGGIRRPGQGYSKFVTTLRIGLLFLAAGLIAVVLTVGIELRQKEGFSLSFATIDAETGEPAMLNPQFTGIDKDNRPFIVTAAKAVQDKNDSRHVHLHDLKATLSFGGQDQITIASHRGEFWQNTQAVSLNGPVLLTTESGYRLTTGRIDVDLKAGSARSNEALSGTGPLGSFKAGGLKVTKKGQRLMFTGGVHITLTRGAAGAAKD